MARQQPACGRFAPLLTLIAALGGLTCTPAAHRAGAPCTDASGCEGRLVCHAGVCKTPPATYEARNPRAGEAPCATGHSVDGVCCNSPCDGACEACIQALTGSPSGMCAPVLEGTDPRQGCAGASTCDGKGGCWSTPLGGACIEGAECLSGHCVDGECCDAACTDPCERCDLTGQVGHCRPVRQGEVPAACDAATAGGACAQAPCHCDAAGACRPSSARPCEGNRDCTAGPCLDGVCCQGPCRGTCMSCNGADTGQESGACAPVLAGYDPSGTCGAAACDGQGRCFARPRGSVCAEDFMCQSGVCADGVCCDRPCEGCQSCRTELTSLPQGTCGPARRGVDPHGTCATAGGCNGSGGCQRRPGGDVCRVHDDCLSRTCCGGLCTHGWQPLPSGTDAGLQRIRGSDVHHLIAVGEYGTILHFDGAAWMPAATVTRAHLHGIAALGEHALAVGERGTVLRYDGRRWQNVATPLTHHAAGTLRDVLFDTPTSAYVAGDDGLLRFGGGVWALIKLPEPVAFRALVRTPEAVLALGKTPAGDGRAFRLQELDAIAVEAPVREPSRAAVWRGSLYVAGEGRKDAPLARERRAAWRALPYPGQAIAALWPGEVLLMAVAAGPQARHDLLAYDGVDWRAEWRSDGDAWIADVWGVNACDVFAVGDGGLILRR